MELCYPAILLIILAIFIIIQITRTLWWGAGLIIATPVLFSALISYILCSKGYKKMAWIAPLFGVISTGMIIAHI